jgi:signal transduction histidine kinase
MSHAEPEPQSISSLPQALAEIARLRRAEHRKGEFLGQLAHEVGNVLVPLPLALEILKQPNLTPRTIERVRDILQEQAVYIQRLISQLRNVSRLTRGIDLDVHTVDLQPLVERVVAGARPQIEQRRHDLVVALPDEPLSLPADEERLEQALTHLLDNAIEHTPPGGRLRPFVRRAGNIDWGAGRLGIGLSLVRRYIEVHGGSVAVESAGPGQGSAFTLRLPLEEEAETPAES